MVNIAQGALEFEFRKTEADEEIVLSSLLVERQLISVWRELSSSILEDRVHVF
jgi:hypothetical protein